MYVGIVTQLKQEQCDGIPTTYIPKYVFAAIFIWNIRITLGCNNQYYIYDLSCGQLDAFTFSVG